MWNWWRVGWEMQLFVMIEMHVVSAARVSSAPVLIGEAGQAGLVWLRSPARPRGTAILSLFRRRRYGISHNVIYYSRGVLLKQSFQNQALRCHPSLPFPVAQVFGYVDQGLSEFGNPSSICAEAISHSIASSTTSSVSRQSASPS